jgi:hypothetical protein
MWIKKKSKDLSTLSQGPTPHKRAFKHLTSLPSHNYFQLKAKKHIKRN